MNNHNSTSAIIEATFWHIPMCEWNMQRELLTMEQIGWERLYVFGWESRRQTWRDIERDREIKREEEVRSVRKMDTCNIHEMRVHLDSVYVEGEETTCLMREQEKDGWEGKDLVGWGIDNFVWGREGLVILCKREREGWGRIQSAVVTSSCFQMTPHFSSAVWSLSLIYSLHSLKIEVLCMLGCKEAQARVVAV